MKTPAKLILLGLVALAIVTYLAHLLNQQSAPVIPVTTVQITPDQKLDTAITPHQNCVDELAQYPHACDK